MIAGLAVLAMVLLADAAVPASTAISERGVSSTSSTIQSAFVLTFQAERNGGNVNPLITSLNSALQLVGKAQAENSTNPAQASIDLRAAQQLALNVTAASATVSAAGRSLRQFIIVRSVVSAVVILIAATLVYAYGGRVFRWLWIRLYRGYEVRPANG
jgi:hypothetical protein